MTRLVPALLSTLALVLAIAVLVGARLEYFEDGSFRLTGCVPGHVCQAVTR